MNFGILGCGYSGKVIAKNLVQQGYTGWGTTRDEANFDELSETGIKPILFDGFRSTTRLEECLADTSHLIISIAPPRDENIDEPDMPVDPVLNAFRDVGLHTLAPKLEWICYLSTVGVYGNHDGAWIDEKTVVNPTSARSRQRVRAESEWIEFGHTHGLPLAIMRLSGIYGPGRNALLSAHNGKSRRLIKPGQVFNRIHVGDIAKAVMLAAQEKTSGVFNITDDMPAPPQDVVTYAHKLLGLEPPAEIDFDTADLSPMARSFYGENKRVSNLKSRSSLGLVYNWPNYRVSLKTMYDEDCWR